MIRILHVVTFMGRGGLETMLMNYYRNIDRTKIQFDFLVHRDFRADYDDEIESLGGIIHRIPRLVPWSPNYRKALNAFFKTHPEYRIVHVHQDCLSSIICKAAKKCGVPVRIAHSHSNSQDKNIKYPIKSFYKRFIPKYATHLFACSESAGSWMFGNHKFEILPNAINTDLYKYNSVTANTIRESFGIGKDEMLIGHVGRFEPPKNHTFLIDVFFELQKNVKAKLILVGDGYLRKSIEQKVTSLNILDKVIFTGIRNDVHNLLQAMDVFVFPSLYEGFPVTLLEVQSSGLPCVISDRVDDVCKLTEQVHHVSLNNSIEEWIKAIISCNNKQRSVYSNIIAEKGYDISSCSDMLCDFYLENWN